MCRLRCFTKSPTVSFDVCMCQECFSQLSQGAKIKMGKKNDAMVKLLYETHTELWCLNQGVNQNVTSVYRYTPNTCYMKWHSTKYVENCHDNCFLLVVQHSNCFTNLINSTGTALLVSCAFIWAQTKQVTFLTLLQTKREHSIFKTDSKNLFLLKSNHPTLF